MLIDASASTRTYSKAFLESGQASFIVEIGTFAIRLVSLEQNMESAYPKNNFSKDF